MHDVFKEMLLSRGFTETATGELVAEVYDTQGEQIHNYIAETYSRGINEETVIVIEDRDDSSTNLSFFDYVALWEEGILTKGFVPSHSFAEAIKRQNEIYEHVFELMRRSCYSITAEQAIKYLETKLIFIGENDHSAKAMVYQAWHSAKQEEVIVDTLVTLGFTVPSSDNRVLCHGDLEYRIPDKQLVDIVQGCSIDLADYITSKLRNIIEEFTTED